MYCLKGIVLDERKNVCVADLFKGLEWLGSRRTGSRITPQKSAMILLFIDIVEHA